MLKEDVKIKDEKLESLKKKIAAVETEVRRLKHILSFNMLSCYSHYRKDDLKQCATNMKTRLLA